jgi:endonuclease/exonuclease/phosphatase family metal-dependent hydrolase
MDGFRVATYNIHKCRGMDGRIHPERIARVLRALHADVYALQEVVSMPGAGREQHQALYFAEELGMYCVKGVNRSHQGGSYGNVVLSRFPVLSSANIDISVAGRERRGVLRADVEIGGRVIHFFNTHLGTGFLERRRQAARLTDADLLRATNLEGPRILMGDLNEWLRDRVTRSLSAELHRVDRQIWLARRYPALIPFLHLDYIYFDGLRLRDAFFHHTPPVLMASDHVPLVADFAW